MLKVNQWTCILCLLIATHVLSSVKEIEVSSPTRLYRLKHLSEKKTCTQSNEYTCTAKPVKTQFTRMVLGGVLPTLKKSNGTFDSYYNDHTGMIKYNGTIKKPYKKFIWAKKAKNLWQKNSLGFYPHGADPKNDHLYIESIYVPNSSRPNELIGFVHLEDFNNPGHIENVNHFNRYRIGIAYSKDGGRQWRYCGHILNTFKTHLQEGNGNKPIFGKGLDNIGGTPYVIKDGYFYIYFSEYVSIKDHHRVGVARALVKDVVAAAKKNKVVEWKKYYKGKWNQAGLTGVGSSVIKYHRNFDDLHTSATYSTVTKRYYLLYTKSTSKSSKLMIVSSKDGVHWGKAKLIDQQRTRANRGGAWIGYPKIISVKKEDSKDAHSVGNEFYVIYAKMKKGKKQYTYNELYRVKVKVTPPAPVLKVNYDKESENKGYGSPLDVMVKKFDNAYDAYVLKVYRLKPSGKIQELYSDTLNNPKGKYRVKIPRETESYVLHPGDYKVSVEGLQKETVLNFDEQIIEYRVEGNMRAWNDKPFRDIPHVLLHKEVKVSVKPTANTGKIEFRVNDSLIKSLDKRPFDFTWIPEGVGEYDLEAKIIDHWGNDTVVQQKMECIFFDVGDYLVPKGGLVYLSKNTSTWMHFGQKESVAFGLEDSLMLKSGNKELSSLSDKVSVEGRVSLKKGKGKKGKLKGYVRDSLPIKFTWHTGDIITGGHHVQGTFVNSGVALSSKQYEFYVYNASSNKKNIRFYFPIKEGDSLSIEVLFPPFSEVYSEPSYLSFKGVYFNSDNVTRTQMLSIQSQFFVGERSEAIVVKVQSNGKAVAIQGVQVIDKYLKPSSPSLVEYQVAPLRHLLVR